MYVGAPSRARLWTWSVVPTESRGAKVARDSAAHLKLSRAFRALKRRRWWVRRVDISVTPRYHSPSHRTRGTSRNGTHPKILDLLVWVCVGVGNSTKSAHVLICSYTEAGFSCFLSTRLADFARGAKNKARLPGAVEIALIRPVMDSQSMVRSLVSFLPTNPICINNFWVQESFFLM